MIIEHDHASPPGPLLDALVARGYDVTELVVVPKDRFDDPSVDVDLPSVHGLDLVVSMGAPWSTYDELAIGTWVGKEIAVLRAADAAGVPVLGVCFGGQLLATAHGGAVHKAPVHELGWLQIETDRPDLVDTGPWFQWHFDRWAPPPDAREIARSSAASQAFLLRRNLAVQFHPEVTAAMLEGWMANGGAETLAAHGTDAERLLDQTRELEPAARVRAERLVGRFLDLVTAPSR